MRMSLDRPPPNALLSAMPSALAFLAILSTLAFGTISPGPSFLLVSRIALSRSRADGVAAALGMGVGGVVFAGLALAGLNALLMQVGWLYAGLKILGGAYLIYLAVLIWRGAKRPLPGGDAGGASSGGAFRLALFTQLSNPKTAVYYASVFAAFLPPHPETWLVLALPPAIFALETGWYALVSLALSSARPRALYLGFKAWIDRGAATVIGALGVKLVVEGG